MLSKLSTFSKPVLRTVFERGQIKRLGQDAAFDVDRMRLRRALEGIDRQVEQDLDDIGSVHAHADVLGQRANGELVVLQAGMHADQMAKVREQLVDADARRRRRIGGAGS